MDEEIQEETNKIVLLLLSRYRQHVDRSGSSVGAIGLFDIDGFIRDATGKLYSRFQSRFELIAKETNSQLSSLYGTTIDFNVSGAASSVYSQLLEYLLYQDPAVKNIRKHLAGEIRELEAKNAGVVPSIIAMGSLAILGGATFNSTTGLPSRNDQGSYFVDGGYSIGMLYTGKKILDLAEQDFLSEYGYSPGRKYRWVHTTPANRALPGHRALQGATFTAETAASVLENTRDLWLLTPYYYPGDHRNCRCFIAIDLI